MKIGSHYLGGRRCEFIVWSPISQKVEVRILSPEERLLIMESDGRGYWRAVAEDVPPGTLYFYRLDGGADRPDPASGFQPEGVHGPSAVSDHSSFEWGEGGWDGAELERMIIYELHVGAFSTEGTFDGVIARLNDLKELGINTLELMPVAQFPGERNWGYDGAYPFAVQNSYGGPEALKRLVDACHRRRMSVLLDVVYNHLGPEGNYLGSFAPYFTERYKTAWGNAINFDDELSDGVRNYFIENALHWLGTYRLDGLRLDATHAIYDQGAKHFLQELQERVGELSTSLGRRFHLIAESDLNDVRVINPRQAGGYGMSAQWLDDFHHSLHTLLTGESAGYYSDFGRLEHLGKAFKEGFVYSWQYSRYRKRCHGSSSAGLPGHRFVVFSQNHDQAGNRLLGERLSQLVDFEALKLAAGATILSPYIPLLFMGEEYGEQSPFLYFVSHGDADLVAAVREGRRAEFQSFKWRGEPPDPQSEETFLRSRLRWDDRAVGKQKLLLDWYRRLIELRSDIPALATLSKENLDVLTDTQELLVQVHRWDNNSHAICVLSFNKNDAVSSISLPVGRWEKVLDSADQVWGGPGTLLPEAIESGQSFTLRPMSFALFRMEISQ